MTGFLIHNNFYNTTFRQPPITAPLRFTLNLQFSYKIKQEHFPILLPSQRTFTWEIISMFQVLKFDLPYNLVYNIYKLYRAPHLSYFQFWLLRDCLSTHYLRMPPLLRQLPILSANYVTRFTDPYYFALFFTILFLPSSWSPLVRWKYYYPQLVNLCHFYLWPFGDFFEMTYL